MYWLKAVTITTITPNLVIMSHWTTSGRSRLKAKQSHGRSFSQKAQQRAAFVAAESMMMQGTVPREITTAANNKRNTETTRRRKNEGKYSMMKYEMLL